MTDTNDKIVTAASAAVVPFDYTKLEGADAAADLRTPFLSIIQNNSKALLEGHARFVKGAKPGMFLNTGSGELIAGQTGFNLVPLKIDHCVVEWEGAAGSGKYIARHELGSPVVLDARKRFEADPNPKKRLSQDVRAPNGNSLVETYYLWVLILDVDGETPLGGAILPFKSTNISIYRSKVYTPLYTYKGTGGRLWVHRMRCWLEREDRPGGSSFNYRFESLKGSVKDSLIDPSSPLMVAVAETVQQIAKGLVTMAEPTPETEVAATPADEVFS
jgi:hypothetical protein